MYKIIFILSPVGPVVTLFVGGGELLVVVVRLLPLLVLVVVLVFAGWALDEWVDDDERPVWLDLSKILLFKYYVHILLFNIYLIVPSKDDKPPIWPTPPNNCINCCWDILLNKFCKSPSV